MASTDVQMRPRPHPRPINPDRRHTVVVGMKASKFRHVVGTSGGKEGTFINLRQVNTRMRPESNGFCINDRWAAVPLSAAGGVVAIFDLHKPAKIADGVIPGLGNGANVADFVWYPFDQNTLVVACDNGVVNFWDIPVDGVLSIQTTPTKILKAHNDRINVIKFNPFAANVLATAANNGEVIIWDTGALESKIRLQTSASPILAMTWSNDGRYLAVVSRDCYLRVYEPRANNIPILESQVLETPKGARVLYVCNDRFILTSSLTKSSQRTVNLYSAQTLQLVHSHPLDTSSSLLIPHYDFDSSVVFLTGKGDRTIQMFEICDESPYFLPLSPFVGSSSHQAIAFTAKNAVNVRKVEFARGARLLLSEIENATFMVPRVKMDYFQNDLFPMSLVTWSSVMEAEDWFRRSEKMPKFISLKPDDMQPLYHDIYENELARYKKMCEAELPRQSSVQSWKALSSMSPFSPFWENMSPATPEHKAEENENGNGNRNGNAESESRKADDNNCNGAGGDIVVSEEKINSASSPIVKRMSGGLVSWPPSEENGSGDSNGKTTSQQPKRLSIDPNNCGTPLRDLLRRCDEMPGVIAMRQNGDESVTSCAEEATESLRHEWE